MRIIGGQLKGKKISEPKDKKTRPLKDMVRESIFNILAHSDLLPSMIENINILDLFSGIGSFGLEAISRGAKKVVFFEEHKPAVNLLIKNIENLGFKKKCEILEKNIYSTQNLDELNYKFELVFLDPPFKDENKNISGIINNLLSSNILTEKTLFILHRNKKSRNFDHKKLNILREEFYGSSKIIFFKFNY